MCWPSLRGDVVGQEQRHDRGDRRATRASGVTVSAVA